MDESFASTMERRREREELIGTLHVCVNFTIIPLELMPSPVFDLGWMPKGSSCFLIGSERRPSGVQGPRGIVLGCEGICSIGVGGDRGGRGWSAFRTEQLMLLPSLPSFLFHLPLSGQHQSEAQECQRCLSGSQA